MRKHTEHHRTDRIGWLRAAVLGANDGIVSTSSLIVGISSANVTRDHVFITGLAALVAGALSMAAGEYVSVSTQADTEASDLEREKIELATEPKHELEELTQIYVKRGLKIELAREVARDLSAHDMLGAHARDELGIFEHTKARPFQAALASACAFASGSVLPLVVTFFLPIDLPLTTYVLVTTFVALIFLGLASSYTGGAGLRKGTLRVVTWGTAAMLITAGIGKLFGVAI